MIVLTSAAVTAVKAAIARAGQTEAGLRVMVEEGGCAGYKYVIGLDAEPRPDDTVVEAEGVRVFIDPDSQPRFAGMRLNFVESLDGSGFAFENPNAAAKWCCAKALG